jgi:hypothetical protein
MTPSSFVQLELDNAIDHLAADLHMIRAALLDSLIPVIVNHIVARNTANSGRTIEEELCAILKSIAAMDRLLVWAER